MKKLQLEVEEDLSFLLFGLVSGFKASKLAYCINLLPPFDFERVADLMLPDFNPKANTSFSKFTFQDEENHLDFTLIANREFGLTLFPELKKFDYLIIVRGGLEFFDAPDFNRKCMKMQGIQLSALIENEKIKSVISGML